MNFKKKNVYFSLITISIFYIVVELASYGLYQSYNKELNILNVLPKLPKVNKSSSSSMFMMDPQLGIRFKPNSNAFNHFDEKSKNKSLKVSKNGRIETHIPPMVNFDKEYNILITGGSAAAGLGATSNTRMWTSVLEQKLEEYFLKNNQKININIINSAVFGYKISTEIQRYINYDQFEEHDLVISLTGWNDSPNVLPLMFHNLNYQHANILDMLYRSNNYFFSSLFPNLHKLLNVKTKLQYAEYIGFMLEQGTVESNIHFSKKIKNFDSLIEGNKKKSLFLLQPYTYSCDKQKIGSDEKLNKLITYHDNLFGNSNLKGFIQHKKEKMLINRSQLKNDNIIDLSCLYHNKEGDFFVDPVHLSDEGQKVLGQRVFEILVENKTIQ